jgi:hypothetical protein
MMMLVYWLNFLDRGLIRCAMLIISLVALWAAWHFWQAGRIVKEGLNAGGDR